MLQPQNLRIEFLIFGIFHHNLIHMLLKITHTNFIYRSYIKKFIYFNE